MDAEKFIKDLRVKIERAKAEASRLEGKIEHLMGKLLDDYGCETIDEAQDLLADKEEELAVLEESHAKHLEDFKQKYEL